jgi:hypothetical protein
VLTVRHQSLQYVLSTCISSFSCKPLADLDNDHTIKPILLYGSDIWGMFNPFTMKCKKENSSFDNIYSGSLCEKIHLKFC